jgi:hypothetical protein
MQLRRVVLMQGRGWGSEGQATGLIPVITVRQRTIGRLYKRGQAAIDPFVNGVMGGSRLPTHRERIRHALYTHHAVVIGSFSAAISRLGHGVEACCFESVTGRTVMSIGSAWRTAAVSAQVAALFVTLGCESGSPTAPRETSTVSPAPALIGPVGALGGTVTINGEARPIVYVALQSGWAFDTTIAGGSWEWGIVPAGDHVVVIKTPPGLTCTRQASR